MPLIESDDLLNRFGGMLAASTKVHIPAAWARSGPTVDRLLSRAPGQATDSGGPLGNHD